MTIRIALKTATAPIGMCVALAAHPVLAQDAKVVLTQADDATHDATDEIVDAEGRPVGQSVQIVVTGSRIRRDEFTSPAPITVIDPKIAARRGLFDTGEMIQGSPIAAGSAQVTAAFSIFSGTPVNGGLGAQTVSLRGLGAERTLVLLNSRRAGPAGTRGGVSSFDLNVLPQSIIERVDILKDGASSIYGSDAVAGVVNLITKTDTDGVEFEVFGSVPQREGGEQWSASATWGKTFERGHILAAVNYFRRNELARGDRKYLRCPENYVFTDESLKSRADLIDPRTGDYACQGSSGNTWGHVWTYDYSYTDADGDGLAELGSPFGSNIPGSTGTGEVTRFQYSYGRDNLGAYIPALAPRLGGTAVPGFPGAGQIAVPAGWYPVGYDEKSSAVENHYHPLMDNDTVDPETNRYTAYLDASYELTDGIEFYTELLYNKRDTFVNSSGQIFQSGYGEVYDYYYDTVGDGLQTSDNLTGFPSDPYAKGWYGPALFSPTAFDPYVDSSIKVEYYRGVAGLRGGLFDNWTYDVYGQYSRSLGTYRDQTALKDAIETANFRSGSTGLNSSACPNGRTPVSDRECIFVDWYSPRFNYGDYTADEYNFLFAWDKGKTRYTQKYAEAILSGNLVELWAGPLGLALGATIREDDINDVPGAIRQADNGFNFGGAGITAGKSVTKEAFAEINIPLLEDLPLVQRLEISAAGRVTNVKATRASDGFSDSDNGNWTYRVSANWDITDFLRVRGTYGTSFRAPALFELFLADQTGSLPQRLDPCIQWGFNLAQGNISQRFADNCAASGVSPNHNGSGINVATVSGGGVGVLDPETSKAWTASVILTPKLSFLPDTHLSLAVDYFNIEVNGEIAQLGSAGILSSCYNSDFFPNDPLCGQFFRFQDLTPGTALYDQYYMSGDPENVAVVFDSFFNVNSQQNRGVDVTARLIHDFPGDTTLSIQGQMTWQLHDTIALFDGFSQNKNGEAGQPMFVGDFNVSLDSGPWSLFYGLDAIGGTDNTRDWLKANGTLCPNYTTLGTVCVSLKTDATFYHSVSIGYEFGKNFTLIAGVSNLLDQHPPRTSDFSQNSDGIQQLGQGALYSQYDLLGRRFFANFKVTY